MSSRNTHPVSQIAIIGVGQVGAAAAYGLILRSIARELLLVDTKVSFRDAQVRDLTDVAYSCNSNTRVRGATYREASQCDIVVITAGSKHSLGQTNTQFMYRNVAILRTIIKAMGPFRSDTILLVVANPIDLLTSLAQKLSGLPISQVLGSGTFLDSLRIRGMLADKAEVAANSIDLYVLGMHGDAQVTAWSTATIGGVPIDKSFPPNYFCHAELENECKRRSQTIIQAKGATPFGIGAVVASICSSILFDKRNVRPISHFQEEFGCALSMPVVLGRKGIIKTIQIPLNSDEIAGIAHSADRLKGIIKQIDDEM